MSRQGRSQRPNACGRSVPRALQAFVTGEVLKWWFFPGLYRQKAWNVELRVRGPGRAGTEPGDGGDEGHLGRRDAANANAEMWTRVLEWLATYLDGA